MFLLRNIQSSFPSAASILFPILIVGHEIRIPFTKDVTQSNFTTLLELCFCQSLHLTPDGLSPEMHCCISFCSQGSIFSVASWESLTHWDLPVHCWIRAYRSSVQLTALGSLITSKPRLTCHFLGRFCMFCDNNYQHFLENVLTYTHIYTHTHTHIYTYITY